MDAALTFTAIQEPEPGEERIRALLPVLEAWYLRDGDAARPSFFDARRALQEHMPELYPTWVTLCVASLVNSSTAQPSPSRRRFGGTWSIPSTWAAPSAQRSSSG